MVSGCRADDPTQALKGALTSHRVKHRVAIVEPLEFGALLRVIGGLDGQPITKAALQLAALLFTRPGELRNAEWSEVDLAKAVWTIPAGRMKRRKEHHVPLCRQALVILEQLKALTGDGPLLFPGNQQAVLGPIVRARLAARGLAVGMCCCVFAQATKAQDC